nr:DUF2304 domain-containing protein [uncultured Eisenbergiella sp.]
MIPIHLKIVLLCALICYFVLILIFLKQKAISLKYTLLWIFAGIILGLMLLHPPLLGFIVKLLGIESSMNGLYVLAIGFIIVILMSITSIVSKQSSKILKLVQTVAQLEKRVRELEKDESV